MDIMGPNPNKEKNGILKISEIFLIGLLVVTIGMNFYFYLSEITTYWMLINLIALPLEALMAFVYFREGWKDNRKRVKRTIKIALKIVVVSILLLIATLIFPVFA